MILQRYTFGSKSQQPTARKYKSRCCLWYCKDIHLEANHNTLADVAIQEYAAYDIAKIYIWKQITTPESITTLKLKLLMILQRYTFGSKSQPKDMEVAISLCCLWYCKDIHLEANHNLEGVEVVSKDAAYDIAKIYIWKQITTPWMQSWWYCKLLMILQRYTFGSKSQHNDTWK